MISERLSSVILGCTQCDQMVGLLVRFLASYNNEILPKSKQWPNSIQSLAKYEINSQKW